MFALSVLFAQSETDSLRQVIMESTDSVETVDAMNQLAFLLRVSKPDSTILLTRQSEQIAKSINYPLGVADAKMRRATAESAMGNFLQAQQLFMEARSAYKKLDNKSKLATCANNIGSMYNSMEDYDKALSYFKESAGLYSELNELLKEGSIINNIGYIYKVKGEYEKALPYLYRTLDRARSLKNRDLEVYPVYNLGSVYMQLEMMDSASFYLNQSLALSRELRDLYITSLTLTDLGIYSMKLDRTEAAQSYLLESYQTAEEAGLRPEKRNAAKYLAESFELQGRFQEALRYHKIYKELSDSLFNKEVAQQMAIQKAEFEFNEARVKEEAEREKVELEQVQELSYAIWIRNTLVGGLLIMSVVSYLLFRNFSRNQKANEHLKDLNNQIQKQSEELKLANREITVMNANLETVVNRRTEELKIKNRKLKEYLSSNSHVVRAPLARILGLVQLYDPEDTENFEFINKSVYESATELDNAIREINEKLSDENV